MKVVPNYIVEFAGNLLESPLPRAPRERIAHGYVLLSVYTGIKVSQLLNNTTISKDRVWLTVKTRTGEEVIVCIGLPVELLKILDRNEIKIATLLETSPSKRDIQQRLEKLTRGEKQKVSVEELPTLFRFMCNKSDTLQRAMNQRLSIISSELTNSVISVSQPGEVALMGISLSAITTTQVFKTKHTE